MAHNIVVLALTMGLAAALAAFAVMRRRAGQGAFVPTGAFKVISGLLAVTPAVLIKLGVVAQTAISVGLSICYFFVFIIGAMLVTSTSLRVKRGQPAR